MNPQEFTLTSTLAIMPPTSIILSNTSSSFSSSSSSSGVKRHGAHLSPTLDIAKQDAFAHLPPYSPPSSGLVSHLPPALIPYAELMRLHKPAGYYAFFFPHLFGIFFAAAVAPSAAIPYLLTSTILIHAAGNLVLRGAACTWNDTLDAPFDRLVARCRHRPVARGAVTPGVAHAFTALQTLAWIAILSCLPSKCWVPAGLLALTMAVYPFCKRFTNFPQVVLGFSLALGQSVGMASMGLNPMGRASSTERRAMLCLYLSNVVNAVVYDTVYAHQDLKDDLQAGVKSMAVACGSRTKEVLSILSLAEVALLAGVAYFGGFSSWFWGASVGGTAAILGYMIATVRLDVPADCWKWFKGCIWLTGAALCTGLGGEYFIRSQSSP